VDSEAGAADLSAGDGNRVEWLRILPFVVLHGMCLGVIWVGWSWIAVSVAALLYLVRMFAITGFYHRYFSHKTFQTTRFWQFLFAFSVTPPSSADPCGGRLITATTTASRYR